MPVFKDGRGRHKKEVDGDLVEKLASIGANLKEIATLVGCSEDTIERRPELMERLRFGWEKMKVSVKRAQFDVAVSKKNPTMLIWMGKQHLGQSDTAGNRAPGGMDQLEALFKALMDGPVKRLEGERTVEDDAPKPDGEK